MIAPYIGRIKADPTRVPEAASMQLGLRDSFAARLDAACREPAQREPQPEPKPEVEAPAAEHDEPALPHGDAPASADATEPSADQPAAPVADDGSAAAAAVATGQIPVRGEPERRIPDGEGPGSPPTSSDRGIAAATDANVLSAGGAAVTTGGAPLAGTAAQSANTAARIDGTRAAGSAGGQSASPTAATAAPSKATGYRTLNKQAVLLTEQARDSVFKQILFKLDKDRGEMRLRLDPPELGELNLHLEVQSGGQLRLSIGAERPELTALLAQNLEPLKHALQQQGLQVVHAEVHTQTGDGGRHEFSHDDGARRRDHESSSDDERAVTRAAGSWASGNGLDFWA